MVPMATTSTQPKRTCGEPEPVPLKKVKTDTENLLSVSDMDPMATSSTKAKLSSDSTGEPELVPLKKIRNAKTRSPDMVPMATTSTQPKASLTNVFKKLWIGFYWK